MLGNWPKGILEDRYDFFFEGFDSQTSVVDTLYEIKNPGEGAFAQRTTAIAAGTALFRADSEQSVGNIVNSVMDGETCRALAVVTTAAISSGIHLADPGGPLLRFHELPYELPSAE